MHTSLDNTPDDGDFARYVDSLSQRLLPDKLGVLSPGEQSRSGGLASDAVNDRASYAELSAINAVRNAPKPMVQPANKLIAPNSVEKIVGDVFKKRNAEARLTRIEKLDAIKNSQRKEPFSQPRDAWEARWQPVFELVNQHRWLIIATVFALTATLDLLSTVLAQEYGFTIAKHTILFDLFDMDSTELITAAAVSGGLCGFLLWKLYALAEAASLEHADSPAIFWSLLAALALVEFALSSSSDLGFGALFWVALAFGGISGGLWRIVRGLHRAGMLFTNDTLK